MPWNWELSDWPAFTWDQRLLVAAEQRFLLESGVSLGVIKHLDEENQNLLRVEILSAEAMDTSAIEGELLDRDSVRDSVFRQLGLQVGHRRTEPREWGVAAMMVNLYQSYHSILTHRTLFDWHRMLMNGRQDITDIGRYRTHLEPMQVVSKRLDPPKIYFEAPPSARMTAEMDRFIEWFNTADQPAITKAGIAHHHFVSIHPFEDGNGRIARALAEKVLAQALRRPSLPGLASTIWLHRKGYYEALDRTQKGNDITIWLRWFAGIVIEAQRRTLALVEYVLDKTKLADHLHGQLNQRQEKAMLRILQAGPQDFQQGITAEKYVKFTGAHPDTATRDLADLTEKGALVREGQRRHTKYFLNVPLRIVPQVLLNERGELVEQSFRDGRWDRDRAYVQKALAEGEAPDTIKRFLIEHRWRSDRSQAAEAEAQRLVEEVQRAKEYAQDRH